MLLDVYYLVLLLTELPDHLPRHQLDIFTDDHQRLSGTVDTSCRTLSSLTMAYRQGPSEERSLLLLQLLEEFCHLPRIPTEGCPFNSSGCTEQFCAFLQHAEDLRCMFPPPRYPLRRIYPATRSSHNDGYARFLQDVEIFGQLVLVDLCAQRSGVPVADRTVVDDPFDRFLAGVQKYQFWYGEPQIPYRLDMDALMGRVALAQQEEIEALAATRALALPAPAANAPGREVGIPVRLTPTRRPQPGTQSASHQASNPALPSNVPSAATSSAHGPRAPVELFNEYDVDPVPPYPDDPPPYEP